MRSKARGCRQEGGLTHAKVPRTPGLMIRDELALRRVSLRSDAISSAIKGGFLARICVCFVARRAVARGHTVASDQQNGGADSGKASHDDNGGRAKPKTALAERTRCVALDVAMAAGAGDEHGRTSGAREYHRTVGQPQRLTRTGSIFAFARDARPRCSGRRRALAHAGFEYPFLAL